MQSYLVTDIKIDDHKTTPLGKHMPIYNQEKGTFKEKLGAFIFSSVYQKLNTINALALSRTPDSPGLHILQMIFRSSSNDPMLLTIKNRVLK